MAYDTTSAADTAALLARRERVRVVAGRVAQAVETIDMPQTFYDGERAVRAVTMADRMLVRLPESGHEDGIAPARQRLRVFADRIMAVIEGLPSPASFRDVERAARCVLATDTLLTQLYAPPRAAKRTRADGVDPADFPNAFDNAPEPEDGAPKDSPEAASGKLFDHLDRIALAYAREVGFYPDGTVCDPAATEDPQRLACADEIEIIDQWMNETAGKPFRSNDGLLPLARIMTARANACVRARARHSGHWPDGRAFQENDGPLFVLSKRFDTEVLKRPGPEYSGIGEVPAHELFPWWLVRNPDTG